MSSHATGLSCLRQYNTSVCFPWLTLLLQLTQATRQLEIQECVLAVATDDELHFIRLRTMLVEVRKLYMVLHDSLVKNMAEIEAPRSDFDLMKM
jgi:hypothetical protein